MEKGLFPQPHELFALLWDAEEVRSAFRALPRRGGSCNDAGGVDWETSRRDLDGRTSTFPISRASAIATATCDSARALPRGSPSGAAWYKGALGRLKGSEGQSAAERNRPAPKTLERLGRLYGVGRIQRLDRSSRRKRAAILESCFAEPRKPGDEVVIGACPLPLGLKQSAQISLIHIRVGNRGRTLDRTPPREVRGRAYASSGFHTRSLEEIANLRPLAARHQTEAGNRPSHVQWRAALGCRAPRAATSPPRLVLLRAQKTS
jgi:hypothetical protein